jgi:predicted metal-dependent peptidase
MDPEKKIKAARVGLLFDHPFFGYLAVGMELIQKDNMSIPTMATDGKNLFYDSRFVEEIPDSELMAIIAHEVMHNVFAHLTRRQNRTPMRWNIACDLAVNDILEKKDSQGNPEFTLPKGALRCQGGYAEFADKTAEYIYSRLPEQKGGRGDGNGEPGKGQPGDGKGVGGGTLDSHEEWDKYEGNEAKDADSPSQEDQWHEAVAQAATQARMAGNLPGHLKQLVDGLLNPQLHWKDVLREMVTSAAKSDYTIWPANMKHLYRGIYLPGVTGEEIKIAVAVDTSGSVSDDELKEFMSEVKGICETYDEFTVYFMTCDTVIHEKITLRPFEPFPTFISGRGGTCYKAVIKEVANLDISALVFLTDGYPNDGFPKEPAFPPIIWVLTPNHGNVPYGRQIVLAERK